MAMRYFKGNAPDDKKYEMVGSINGFDVWIGRENRAEWLQIKFVSQKKRRVKANYWFGILVDGAEPKGRDYNFLVNDMPDTAADVVELAMKYAA